MMTTTAGPTSPPMRACCPSCWAAGWGTLWIALVALLVVPAVAAAQTNERIFEGLNFRFATPGARAVGMGVSFVGLADDATAAVSNPAGLSNLRHVEFSVEILGSHASQRYLVGNTIEGAACQTACDRFGTFGHTSWVLPSFASVAVPLGDVTLAAFANSQQQFVRRFDLEPRVVPAVDGPFGTLGPTTQTGESGSLDVSVRNYGAAGAWVARQWLSAGASFLVSHLQLDSEGRNLEGATLRSRTRTSASVLRPSFSAGVLMRATHQLTLGVGYYHGATFPMRTEVSGTFGNAAGSRPADRCLNQSFARPDRPCDPQPPLPTDYVVPTRVSVGGSYRVSPRLTVVGEAAHVRYSQLVTRNFQVVDFRFTGNISPDDFWYDNVNDYHAGFEYRRPLGGHMLAVRAGAFTDPPHTLHFRVTGTSSADAVENFVFNTNAPTAIRVGSTFGFGMTFGNRLQGDVAVSLVAGTTRLVMSVVRRIL